MGTDLENRVITLERKIQRFETWSLALAIVAVVFGVSGAWGYHLLAAARDKITVLEAQVKSVEDIFKKARETEEQKFSARLSELRDAALKQIADRARAADQAGATHLDESGARAEMQPTQFDRSSPASTNMPVPAVKSDLIALHLEVTSYCWVRVTVDDVVQIERTLKAGDTREVKPGRSVQLQVGNAGAVNWSINGRRARSLGRLGETASVKISRSTLGYLLQ